MRNLTRVSIIMAGSAALVGSMALPASADVVSDGSARNVATVEIQGGALTLDTTAAELSLDHKGPATGNSEVTGTLKGVSVNDLNSDGLGWSTSVSLESLSFEGKIIDVDSATYTNVQNLPLTEGAPTVETDGASMAVTSVGNSKVVWDVEVAFTVPNTVIAGIYTGQLVHSLS